MAPTWWVGALGERATRWFLSPVTWGPVTRSYTRQLEKTTPRAKTTRLRREGAN